ncbi:ABC transporter F family member 4 [Zea mays]|jgi:ATP-binding cassette, subfamily F, member 1|uniref:ABC transporter F family member 4 n=2 Tax=Zea mays TaxID=4577 RepID=A0A1D6F948_MAIZE|nr:ABC transporter F family member 4 [Zea mays]ONM27676.1 ABC transporter F family member 4 [Zea mays]
MGRKDTSSSSAATGGGKKEKPMSVSAMLASMDAPAAKAKSSKAKAKAKPSKAPASSYMGDIDLPPSDDEDEEEARLAAAAKPKPARAAVVDLSAGAAPSHKDAKKKDKREAVAAAAAEAARQEALRDDRDAFSVVIGARVPGSSADDGAVDDNVRDVVLENFSVSARGKELLKGASLRISHGRRYGLVGPNGMGKSTLLKLLAWRQVPVPRNIDVLLVEQEIIGDDRSALEAVVAADEELTALRAEQARLEVSNDADDNERLLEVYEKLNLRDSDAARARASKILAGLGFDQAMQARSTKSFSGGWRMRISLARALFMQPTLLLLDEPTNHLDLRAVLWLEEYLCSQWKKTLIVVSHDRDFLNTVCNEIIHLHDKSLHVYRGNFDDFESGYEQKRKEMNRKFEVYEKQMKAARKSGSKAAQDKVKGQALSKAAKEAAKNKGKGKSAADDDDDQKHVAVPQKWRDYSVEFHFPEPTELTPPLLQLIEVGFSYPGRPDFKLSGVDVGIDMGTRVAIVGPNGAGKSTILNLLAGDLTPTEGEVRRSQKLRIGRYSQHFVDLLTMEENAVQYLLRLHPDQEGMSKAEAVRAKLGKFGLPGHNHLTPIVKLSGGQKARVVFTSISMSQPHILLLDEPTNHLDMQSIDALADALDEFTGGVVLVSHDSRLISRVCDDEQRSEIWVVEDGSVDKYDGTFEDYKDELMEEIKKEVEE